MTRPELVSFDDALVAMMGHANPVAQREQVATMQATGRVLADDLRAPMNVPAMDNTQMDGYAVRAAEVTPGRPLAVEQRIAAGQVPGPLAAGTVARIFTGATMPAGADAVVMQEEAPSTATR